MKIFITICARGGSKGITNKNIKEINGIPLIGYSIRTALEFAKKYKADIGLSTDSHKIKEIAKSLGLSTKYLRPVELASDKAGKILVIKDILDYEEKRLNKSYDYILDLDVTSPFRTLNDISEALEMLKSNLEALNIFSVNSASKNPYFNMVENEPTGFVKLGKQGEYLCRQNAPAVYEMNASIYWYRRGFFDLKLNSPVTDKSIIFQMNHICFDIDHQIDFDFMEYLIQNNKLDFEL